METDIKRIVISESDLLELPSSAYECDLCGLKVRTKANLQAHRIKTHRILENAKDIAFFTKQKLTSKYVYHCPIIPCKHNIDHKGGFSTYSRLKQHYQHVHMQKDYQCLKCQQSFPTPSYQAYHMRLCGLTYTCSVCSRCYSQKKHLLQHYRRSGHKDRTPTDKKAFNKSENTTTTTNNNNDNNNDNNNNQCFTACKPLILPFLMLPVPVINIKNNELSLENDYSNIINGHINNNVNNNSNQSLQNSTSVLYSNAISTLQTVSSHLLTNANLKIELPKLILDSTGSLLALQSNENDNCHSLCTNNFSVLSDASTQTDSQYICTNETPQSNVGTTAQTPYYVSVNTCTDEDDISAFFGGLFCDAGVGTSFSFSENTESGCDPNILNVGETFVPEQYSFNPQDEPIKQENIEEIFSENYHPATLCSVVPVERENQTQFIPLCENIAMQTDTIEKINAQSATHDHSIDESNHFSVNRMLETPPPIVRQTNVSLSTHLTMACQTLCSMIGESQDIPKHLACNENINSSAYSNSSNIHNSNLNFMTESSNDAKLTNSVDFSHNHTQTMTSGIDLWLNSVETQTSLEQFDSSFFSDMCVGVDDNFFSSFNKVK